VIFLDACKKLPHIAALLFLSGLIPVLMVSGLFGGTKDLKMETEVDNEVKESKEGKKEVIKKSTDSPKTIKRAMKKD